ncbi:MAG TPA: arylesterase [Bryobacteraceae bacterium]|jgi:acyl-CoA thioesterase-1
MIMAVRANSIVAALLSLTLYGCGGRQQAEQPKSESAPAAITPAAIDTRPVIVAFGDSLTAGYGVEPGKSYPDFLQQRLDAAGYKYHVVNLGVSGDTTTDGIQRLPDVLAAKPELVILEFGGNDGLRGLPVATTRANMTQMIQTLHKANIQILLAGMTLPRNYGSAYIHSFEQVYIDLASQFQLPAIPFLLEGVGGHPDLTQPDGIHPTAEGCEIVSGNVMKYLKPLVKK